MSRDSPLLQACHSEDQYFPYVDERGNLIGVLHRQQLLMALQQKRSRWEASRAACASQMRAAARAYGALERSINAQQQPPQQQQQQAVVVPPGAQPPAVCRCSSSPPVVQQQQKQKQKLRGKQMKVRRCPSPAPPSPRPVHSPL